MSDSVYRKEIEASIRSLYGDKEEEGVSLDLEAVGVPEEISDSYSANYGQTQALGRSSPMVDYANGGPREVSFSLLLREDKMPEGKDIVDVVRSFRSLAYPEYREMSKKQVLRTGVVRFVLGDMFSLRGVCTSVDVSWTGPYGTTSDNKTSYFQAEVSLTFMEVVQKPLSAGEIISRSNNSPAGGPASSPSPRIE